MDYFVIGERELVLGFKLAGVQGAYVSNRNEALEAFCKVTGKTTGSQQIATMAAQDRPKILILTEDVSDMLSDEVTEWQMKGSSPVIVEIPGLNGHIKGRKTLTDSIREAIGIQV